jgi:hypothetical protein
MKTLFIALALMVFIRTGFSQGTVLFSNRELGYGIDAPIYNFDGKPLSGADWYAQLYYAAPYSSGFVPAGDPLIFRTGNRAGYFDNTVDQNRTLAGIPAGARVQVQIRVWKSEGGTSYESALRNGKVVYSFAVMTIYTSGMGNPPGFTMPLLGLQPMYMIIPEPSIIALGLGGAGVLFLRRRK